MNVTTDVTVMILIGNEFQDLAATVWNLSSQIAVADERSIRRVVSLEDCIGLLLLMSSIVYPGAWPFRIINM